MAKCEDCDGTGQEERERNIYGVDVNGPYLSVWPYWRECETCSGSGEVEDD